MRITVITVIVLGGLLIPVLASAQRLALFAGYEWTHPGFEDVHLFASDLNGWKAGAVVPISNGLSVVADVDGEYGKTFNTGVVVRPIGTARPWFYTFEAGPRYTLVPNSPINPFVEGFLGITHAQVGTMGVDFLGTTTDTRFEGGVGGGVAIHLTHTVGVQGDVGYRRGQPFDQRLNRFQIGTRFVWWPGGK